jgi:hypothetical protein
LLPSWNRFPRCVSGTTKWPNGDRVWLSISETLPQAKWTVRIRRVSLPRFAAAGAKRFQIQLVFLGKVVDYESSKTGEDIHVSANAAHLVRILRQGSISSSIRCRSTGATVRTTPPHSFALDIGLFSSDDALEMLRHSHCNRIV